MGKTSSFEYAHAQNSKPLAAVCVSPHVIVFLTRPRIHLRFDLHLSRIEKYTCVSKYCSQLPEPSHYVITDLNPFFYRTLSTLPQRFLGVETAMLLDYS